MAERSRRNDPEGTRKRIVDAAFDAFCRDGYGVTATNDLRERASVSGGAFSHHFPSKKGLALAVVQSPVREAVDAAWIRPVLAAPTLSAGIVGTLDSLIAGYGAAPDISGCPLGNLAAELSGLDADFQRALAAVYDEWTRAYAAKLAAERGKTEPGAEEERIAGQAVAAISGALLLAKATQSVRPLEDCRALVSELMERVSGNG